MANYCPGWSSLDNKPMADGKLKPNKDFTRSSVRRRSPRTRSRWYILFSSFFTCAAIGLLVATSNSTLPWLTHGAYFGDQSSSTNSQDSQAGTVVVQSGQDACDILKFDNNTGRTIDSSQHCHSSVVRDARGTPVPMGTVHRLNSISRSFLGSH